MGDFKISDTAQVLLVDSNTGEKIALGSVSMADVENKASKKHKYKAEITLSDGSLLTYGTDKLIFSDDENTLETDFATIKVDSKQ